MTIRLRLMVGWSLTALALVGLAPGSSQSDTLTCSCDYSSLPGVIWWGSPGEMTVAELAAYAAPVYWFSPDEPSLGGIRGPGIMAPEAFPFEEAESPVVYFQLKEIVSSAHRIDPTYRETGSNRANAIINTANGALLLMEYYAYFGEEQGFSAHRHDVEGTEIRIALAPSDGEYLSSLDFPDCGESHSVMFVTRVTGKAHGLEWYWNILDVENDALCPMNMLVEEGKHALAPDRNGDGYFTPSYDVNVRINDAWGVRDIIRSGGLFAAGNRGRRLGREASREVASRRVSRRQGIAGRAQARRSHYSG